MRNGVFLSFLKDFLKSFASVPCLGFFHGQACEILAPWPGIEPSPFALEGEVPPIGQPGKSPGVVLVILMWCRSTNICYYCLQRWWFLKLYWEVRNYSYPHFFRWENWGIREIITCPRCWAGVWWVSMTVPTPTGLSPGSSRTAQGTHHLPRVCHVQSSLPTAPCFKEKTPACVSGRPPACWLWWWMWHVRATAVLVLRPVCLFLFGRFSAWPLRWWDWETDVGAWSHHRSCWLPWWPVSLSWASTTGSPAPGAWISRCSLGPVCVDVTEYLELLGAGFWGVRGLSAPKALCTVMHVLQGQHPASGLAPHQPCSWVGEDPLVTS